MKHNNGVAEGEGGRRKDQHFLFIKAACTIPSLKQIKGHFSSG